jgi:hypothetical protein
MTLTKYCKPMIMKKMMSALTTAVALSMLSAAPLLSQTAPKSNAADPASQSPSSLPAQDEKAEDAALLQQLEVSGQDAAPKHTQNHRSAGTLPLGAGGGMGGGAVIGAAPVGMQFRGQNLFTRPAGSNGKPLLVRTSEPEPKTQAALEEDLTVMAHILSKAIDEFPGGQGHTVTAMGIDVFFTPGSSPLRSLYLDNYGAVFFLNVSFPLVAAPEKHQEEKPAADSAWEDAKQEVYGQRPQATGAGEPPEEYSQEKVDKLKGALLETLKNATNIRDLKPDEFVTLWVSGGISGGMGIYRVVKRNSPGALGGNLITADQPTSPARKTILTIRATKSEIDAYAQGKLTSEEFKKHARITTYSGGATGGGADGVVFGGGYGGRTRF